MSDPNHEDTQRKKAVALGYDADSTGAPKIIAKGSGYVAEQILALAKQHDIHIHQDPDLLNILVALDIQTEIPEDLFKAVAEILAFVYQLNKSVG